MPNYFEFEVSLLGIKPRIWRSVQLKSTATFQNLHDAIQDAGGWCDYHLFEFQKPTRGRGSLAGTEASDDDKLYEDDEIAPSAKEVKLSSWFKKKGDECLYLYDFGDGWELSVVLKEIVIDSINFKRHLVDGARAFPPEDCGGTFGYEECLAAIGAETNTEYDEEELAARKEWLGDWRPEEFNLQSVRDDFDE